MNDPPSPPTARLFANGEYRLIDMDCVCKIGELVGSKANKSSAFAPPEMTGKADGGMISLRDCESPALRNLKAHPTYDIWGFGVMLYQALRWKPLFEARWCERSTLMVRKYNKHVRLSPAG